MAAIRIFKKDNKSWVKTFEQIAQDDATNAYIYGRLSNDLIAKKLNNCLYIKSIKRQSLYNGTCNIIVYYDNGTKVQYTIESR